MSEERKSWRDVFKIHPAAEIFPMLPEDDLRQLGEDIRKNGLKEPIALWSLKPEEAESRAVILDGRNRLAAMELVGMETVELIGNRYRLARAPVYLCMEPNPYLPTCRGINPFFYALSKNIRRRHLSKEEQADLIVRVMKLEQEQARKFESCEISTTSRTSQTLRDRWNRDASSGHFSGSTKDAFKEKVIDTAAQQGISKRTAENAIAKDRGPTFERAPNPPRTNVPNVAIDRIARDAIKYLEPKFNTLRQSDIAQVLTAIAKHFQDGVNANDVFYRKRKPRTDIFDQRPPWEQGND